MHPYSSSRSRLTLPPAPRRWTTPRRWFGLGFISVATLLVANATVSVTPLPDDPKCTEQDRGFMRRANEMAALTAQKGNSSYGAVLVKDGTILMEFGNDARMTGDTTHHAETGLIS